MCVQAYIPHLHRVTSERMMSNENLASKWTKKRASSGRKFRFFHVVVIVTMNDAQNFSWFFCWNSISEALQFIHSFEVKILKILLLLLFAAISDWSFCHRFYSIITNNNSNNNSYNESLVLSDHICICYSFFNPFVALMLLSSSTETSSPSSFKFVSNVTELLHVHKRYSFTDTHLLILSAIFIRSWCKVSVPQIMDLECRHSQFSFFFCCGIIRLRILIFVQFSIFSKWSTWKSGKKEEKKNKRSIAVNENRKKSILAA